MKVRSIVFWMVTLVCTDLLSQHISFLPADEDMYGKPGASMGGNAGELYVFQYRQGIGYKSGRLQLQKWNGQFWSGYPVLDASEFSPPEEFRMGICLHQSGIYAAGSFVPKGADSGGIVRWDGAKWQVPAGGLGADYLIHRDISVKEMVSIGNRLYVCGTFNIAGGKPVKNFAYLENNTWTGVSTNTGAVNGVSVYSDTLYAAGKFSEIAGVPVMNLAAATNGNWYGVPSVNQEILGISARENGLHFATADSFYLLNGSQLNTYSNGWNYHINHLDNIVEFNGSVYCSGNFTGSGGMVYHLLQWNGNSWTAFFRETEISPMGLNQFYLTRAGKSLFFSGEFTALGGNEARHIVELKPGYSMVKGRVYKDKNGSCQYDSGDEISQGVIVSLNGGQSYCSTDEQGMYTFMPGNGSMHSLTVFPDQGNKAGCLGDLIQISLPAHDTTVIRDIPLIEDASPAEAELLVQGAGGFKARHGYKNAYTITYKSGELPQGELHLKFPLGLHFQKADKPLLHSYQDELIWEVEQDTVINLEFLMDPTKFSTGDTLDFHGFVKHTSNSTVLDSRLRQTVVSAFDPNDKQSNKQKIATDETSLEYHIRFQNLGNDSAVSVFIVDTISPSLPMQYIRVLGNSHSAQYKLNYKIRDHAIIWSFNDIYLPPKITAGEMQSSGFVTMKAGLAGNLKPGDKIENQAHIYFDYQDPVATNVASTEVIQILINGPDGSALTISPNPASHNFYLNCEPFLIRSAEVYDAAGRKIFGKEFQKVSGKVLLDLPSLPDGVYTVRVDYSSGVVSGKLMIASGN